MSICGRAARLLVLATAGMLVLFAGGSVRAAEAIPDGLHVSFKDGMIQVTAKERSVKEIMEAVAKQAGFALEGADLLPQDRVSVLLAPRPARSEVPNLLNLAPKLNFVVVFADPFDAHAPIVRVALYPREGNPGVASVSGGGSARGGGSSYTPPPPPPPMIPNNAVPQYIPPETPPVYIPPDSPPVYIPPDAPPQYIPADGPPVYIPPAPPPGGDPSNNGLN